MGIFYFWTNQSCQLMSDFKVTILGNGSAVPTASQNPSSQIVMLANEQFMIDCGEATQMQMIKYKIKHRNLNHIFISHLHGDHYFGIFGLISVRIISIFYVAVLANTDSNFPFQNQKAAIYKNQNIVRSIFYLQ